MGQQVSSIFRTLSSVYETVCAHTPLRAFLYTFIGSCVYQSSAIRHGYTEKNIAAVVTLTVVTAAAGFSVFLNTDIQQRPECPNFMTALTTLSTFNLVDYLAYKYFISE